MAPEGLKCHQQRITAVAGASRVTPTQVRKKQNTLGRPTYNNAPAQKEQQLHKQMAQHI